MTLRFLQDHGPRQSSASAQAQMSPCPCVAAQDTQICVVLGGSMALGHQYGRRWQPRLWESDRGTDINTDPSYNRAMNPDMALGTSLGPNLTMAPGGSVARSHQPGPHYLRVFSSASLHSDGPFLFSFSPISPPYDCSS